MFNNIWILRISINSWRLCFCESYDFLSLNPEGRHSHEMTHLPGKEPQPRKFCMSLWLVRGVRMECGKSWLPSLLPKTCVWALCSRAESWGHCVQKTLWIYRAMGDSSEEEEPSLIVAIRSSGNTLRTPVGSWEGSFLRPDHCFKMYVGCSFYSGEVRPIA